MSELAYRWFFIFYFLTVTSAITLRNQAVCLQFMPESIYQEASFEGIAYNFYRFIAIIFFVGILFEFEFNCKLSVISQ